MAPLFRLAPMPIITSEDGDGQSLHERSIFGWSPVSVHLSDWRRVSHVRRFTGSHLKEEVPLLHAFRHKKPSLSPEPSHSKGARLLPR